jgi:glucokinase
MPKTGAIGIDVGGTKTLFALFDDSFELVDQIKERTETEKQAFTSNLITKVGALLKKADKTGLTVKAIGAGVAGDVNTDKGLVRSSPNIPALEDFSFRKALAKLTDLDVGVYNDVNAALFGEHKFGAAVGYKHVIGVFIGTGIGGAIIIGGKLFLGATGHAGDIGNYLVQPFGPLAGSARHGVLDDVASRTAIAGVAATLAAKQWAPNLLAAAGTDIQNIRSSALAAAIKAGDDTIEELVRSRAQIVGIVLSNLVDFLNPELIVLGGGLTDAMPDLIRDAVEAGIQGHATENARKAVKVVTAQLTDHAVTTGAAKLALDLAQ